MTTNLIMFNGQLVVSAGIAGPGPVTCPDDGEAQALVAAGYAQVDTSSGWDVPE